MNVLFAGGGTGGHVFPAIAVAQWLRQKHPAIRLLFVGSTRGVEARIIPAHGFEFEPMSAGALKGVSLAVKMTTLRRLPASLASAREILKRFGAEVVVGIGGYASGPAVMAAAMCGCPRMILEQNSIPGLTNRLLAYFSTYAAVNFEESARFFPGNAVVTGNPVRESFFNLPAPLNKEPFTVLVFGGSQGASAVNGMMRDALEELCSAGQPFRFIHQSGEKDFERVKAAYINHSCDADVRPFFDDMPEQFRRAHLIVARSGASALAEIAAAGRPSILIPLPTATDNHQRRNAEVFRDRGAGVLMDQKKTTGAELARTILKLRENSAWRSRMAEAARSLARPDAAEKIGGLIEALAGVRRTQSSVIN
ncbi:MAG: undecaprenyldiphospho-muramoylpentapeptide beta-N-acetylglucosaminyltransferase [Acidobacteriia bacterium]|nr:undecaprenyldiphospho-muramoylpentapeptide beta-N-acetylglucosaminyltransferase [Terriglobia bacterium]